MSKNISRRTVLASGAAIATGGVVARSPGAHAQTTPRADAQTTPGVTATEIKIGHTGPYSGPASAYGVIGDKANNP